jgi:glucose 1-dehydrogenase
MARLPVPAAGARPRPDIFRLPDILAVEIRSHTATDFSYTAAMKLEPPQRGKLAGQIAIVTGAGSGIGAAVAAALAAEGAYVIVNHPHQPDPARAVVEHIISSGGRGMAKAADVSKEDEVIEMFREVVQEHGTLDILVANAGLQRDSAFCAMSLADWKRVLEVNLTGQFLCAREAAREFMRRGPDPSRFAAIGKII